MRPRVLVLTALLALGFPAHSTASDTGSLDSSPPPTPLVSVQLERDSTLIVTRVEPSSLGIVRVIHEDGSEEFVANHRIRWIRDADGRDRTSYVLDRGKSLGEAPVSIRYASRRASRTLRGSPLPTRKSFPVIQAGLLARLDRDQDHPSDHPVSLMLDLGGMKNVTERWSAGWSLCFAGDEDFSRLGTKVRFRRWLGPAIAIDAAPGILFAKDISSYGSHYLPGFVGELGVSFGDWVSVTAQMEASRRERYYFYRQEGWFEGASRLEGRTEVSWYFGGKFGGEAAIVGTFGTLLLAMILAGGVSPTF